MLISLTALESNDVLDNSVLLMQPTEVVSKDIAHLTVFVQERNHYHCYLGMTMVQKRRPYEVHSLNIPDPRVFKRNDL